MGRATLCYGSPAFEQYGLACVYYGYRMGRDYQAWRNLSVDHVIPAGDAKRLGTTEWYEDIAKLVTCRRAFNDFLNGYRVERAAPATLEEFFDFRDRHFALTLDSVRVRHQTERNRYMGAYPKVRVERPVLNLGGDG